MQIPEVQWTLVPHLHRTVQAPALLRGVCAHPPTARFVQADLNACFNNTDATFSTKGLPLAVISSASSWVRRPPQKSYRFFCSSTANLRPISSRYARISVGEGE